MQTRFAGLKYVLFTETVKQNPRTLECVLVLNLSIKI